MNTKKWRGVPVRPAFFCASRLPLAVFLGGILTPQVDLLAVPEPATWALALLGLVGAVIAWRRRR